jgi:hypothetical protein
MVARNLLTGIWARLGNRSYSYGGAYNSATPHVGKQIYAFGYQFDFERTPYMTEGVTGVILSGRDGGSLNVPTKEQRNLAFNSYSIMCLENKNILDENYSNFKFKWDKSRFEKPYARFHELTTSYTNLILRKWPIRDVTTPYDQETSGMWGRETGFRVPESFDEEFKRLNEEYNVHWKRLDLIDRGSRPWKNPDVINDSIFPTYGTMDLKSQENFFVLTDTK